jgi:hypothetical protein
VRSAAVRWTELHDAISEQHLALVAVHRSDSGQLALLLRHALVPTSGLRRVWRRDIQRAARDVARDLRAAGLRGRLLIVQRLPPVRARRVLDRWRLLWQRDPLRASELRTMARRRAADARFLTARTTQRRRGRPPRIAIEQWYADLAPLWLGLGPEPRRRLVLQTHVWITERLTAPIVESDDAAYEAFRQRLERLVPPDDRDRWAAWIDAVVVTLLRAFDRPPALRDARWVRSLFLAACRVAPPLPHDARLNAF